jgi:hypothetical protein
MERDREGKAPSINIQASAFAGKLWRDKPENNQSPIIKLQGTFDLQGAW